MIVVRTPFRIPLGGGSTDLPSYYSQHGGFIFAASINLYLYITVTRPPVDDLIRFKYSQSEEVNSLDELRHNLGREALRAHGITGGIEVASVADVPQGAGLGSSGSYMVGLLHALHALKGNTPTKEELAHEACHLTMNVLKFPDGKQDPYATALGGFPLFEIEKNGTVNVMDADISSETTRQFEENSLLFYTGALRGSKDILAEQNQKTTAGDQNMIEQKHKTKEIGKKILDAFRRGALSEFGSLLDEHWRVKKQMSQKMSSGRFDAIYETAKSAGALGGKLLGAGGGGFFLFYAEGPARDAVPKIIAAPGLPRNSF